MEQAKNVFQQKIYYGYEVARSWTFLLQSLSLPMVEMLATRQSKNLPKDFLENIRLAHAELLKLLEKDAENIAQGIYPAIVLKPESARSFFFRYPKILMDGIMVARRRLSRRQHDLGPEAKEHLADVPDYFQRNFHFQTGGYLTEASAELYEHQVEILFAGAADAMRRLILPPMKRHFKGSQGEGLHFLEVAAGTGRLTRFVKLAFPKARITVMDLSSPYLKKAQSNLREFSRLDFVQGDAASLPFLEQRFDAVYSCFLFHELPLEERKKVIAEADRVLQPGGFCGLVDAIQMNDRPDFEWALSQFPVDFHEPFFKNYQQNPMEGLLLHQGFEGIETNLGFFSKAVTGRKPPSVTG